MQIERQRFFQAALVAGIWYICQAGDYIELTSPKQAATSTYGNPLTIQIGAVLPVQHHALVALFDQISHVLLCQHST